MPPALPSQDVTIDGAKSLRWVLEAIECKALAVQRIARLRHRRRAGSV